MYGLDVFNVNRQIDKNELSAFISVLNGKLPKKRDSLKVKLK